MINAVVENLISRQVLKKVQNPLELTSRLCRLQCSKSFYISYLSSNEPRNCLRCSFNVLNDFPRKNNKLIIFKKTYMYYYISEAAKPFSSKRLCFASE